MIKDGYCKPVENSCVLLFHDHHYWCIKARGTEVPTIDPGKLILCKISRRATFYTENVNAQEMKEDDNDNASETDSEKMPKKKNRKVIAEEEQKGELEMKIPNLDGNDQENELRAKNEIAAKPETKILPSNPKEDESEGMKKLATKQKTKC